MWTSFKALLRITAVRLSIAYTLAFGLLAVILVLYMTGSAVDYLRQQFQSSINEEVASLRAIYDSRGLNVLVRTMEVRARAPASSMTSIALSGRKRPVM